MIAMVMVTLILGLNMIITLVLEIDFCASHYFPFTLSKVPANPKAAFETQPKFPYEK